MAIVDSLLLRRVEELSKQASQAEQGANYPRAASLYAQLAQCEEDYASRYVTDPKARATWKERATIHRSYAGHLAKGPPSDDNKGPAQVAASVSGDVAGLLAIIDSLIVKESPVHWDDIAGLDHVKQRLKMAFVLALAKKPAETTLPPSDRILLYGPPGTGKTLLASAVAGSIPGSTFFNAQLSQLSSKWYGESSRLVTLLYQRAREKAPSVVFLDEVDTIARRRDDSHEATVASLNALLQELSGMHDKVGDRFVLTFAATNRPRALDDAFLSRIARAICVPLPDQAARRQTFFIHLGKRGIPVSAEYDELAAMTEGYSGRDIANLCTQAVMTMVEEKNAVVVQLLDKGVDAVRDHTLDLRPLTRDDVTRAATLVKPSASQDTINDIERWRKERGYTD